MRIIFYQVNYSYLLGKVFSIARANYFRPVKAKFL